MEILVAVIALYVSMYIIKAGMAWADSDIIVSVLLKRGVLPSEDGGSPRLHRFVMRLTVWLASAASLVVFLPALLVHERWSFFKRYPKESVIDFAKSQNWD